MTRPGDTKEKIKVSDLPSCPFCQGRPKGTKYYTDSRFFCRITCKGGCIVVRKELDELEAMASHEAREKLEERTREDWRSFIVRIKINNKK